MSRKKLYLLLSIACFVGYVWVVFQFKYHIIDKLSFRMCIFKKVTTIPCPSCGSTRSVLELFRGNVIEAISFNPLGLIIITILMVAPVWILFDLILKKDSLYAFYNEMEKKIKQRKYYIPAILFVIIIWIWNIYKEL